MGRIRTRSASRLQLHRRLFVIAVGIFVCVNLYVLTRPRSSLDAAVVGEGGHRCAGGRLQRPA